MGGMVLRVRSLRQMYDREYIRFVFFYLHAFMAKHGKRIYSESKGSGSVDEHNA
jgi:hypothetical protein